MDTTTAFIIQLRDGGINMTSTDGNLAITPASRLTPAHRDFIKQHKDEILLLLEGGQSGSDLAPANTPPIPERLARAATRVCIEVHNDPPEAIEAMLLDLAHYPAEDWPKLVEHFEARIPPDFDNRRTCRDCLQLASTDSCRAAQQGPIPTAVSTWKPDPERLRRCLWFMPKASEQDQRIGHERWPGLELVPGIATEGTP